MPHLVDFWTRYLYRESYTDKMNWYSPGSSTYTLLHLLTFLEVKGQLRHSSLNVPCVHKYNIHIERAKLNPEYP
jgi:hypothetical protein